MKNIYLILFALVTTFNSNAQLEASKWYFGYQAALDFSSGTPVPLFDSQMSQWEGSASIADHDGNLLFYTDGLSVWNKDHDIMPNGTGMLGDPSSTQSGIIVPKPGSDSIYYIFVTSGTTAHYSELDMTLDGGLGDITANKNILLSSNSAEKLAGVHASNGTDFWVSIHENSSATFRSYYVDENGVNTTAVFSTVGNVLVGNIGQLQFSPDGTRAAMASYSSFNSETIEVFDFDAATGTFSNQIGLPTVYFQTYGLEFSPSGKLLYGGADPDVYEIHQWNLDAGSVADIIASNTIVGTTIGTNGSLQLGPDGKIYMAFESSYYLGVVNSPDSLGLACDWDAYGVNLSPKSVGLGLPNFLANYFAPNNPTVALYASTTSVCQKFCVNFFDSSQNNPVAWQWTFEGASPSFSTEQNPDNICFTEPGTFDVTLITTDAGGEMDTLTLADYITVYPTPPFPTIAQNGYLLIASYADTYQWQLNAADIPGATEQVYEVSQSGMYTVIAYDVNGCKNSSSLYVQLVGIDEVNGMFSFSAFPNPSSGLFNINWPNNLPNDELTIEVFNALGQLIYSSEGKFLTGNNFELNLSDRAPGVYLVQLRTNKFFASKKINILN